MNDHFIETPFVMITYEGAGGYAGTARKGFIFNTAFVGAHDYFIVIFLLNKIYIDAFFGEGVTVADLFPFFIYFVIPHIRRHFNVVRRSCIKNKIVMMVFYSIHV